MKPTRTDLAFELALHIFEFTYGILFVEKDASAIVLSRHCKYT